MVRKVSFNEIPDLKQLKRKNGLKSLKNVFFFSMKLDKKYIETYKDKYKYIKTMHILKENILEITNEKILTEPNFVVGRLLVRKLLKISMFCHYLDQ